MRPAETEIAWAAGLFEGEGCILSRIGDTGRATITFVLGTTDRDVLERFLRIVGCGAISGPEPRKNKDLYRWQCARQGDVEKLTDWLLPYMGERRRDAIERAWHRFSSQPAPMPRADRARLAVKARDGS